MHRMFSKVCFLSRNSCAASAVSRKFDLRLPIPSPPWFANKTRDTMRKVGKAGEGDSGKTRGLPPASSEQFAIVAIAELLSPEDGMADASPEEFCCTKLSFARGVCPIEQGGDLAVTHADLPGVEGEQRIAPKEAQT